MHFYPHDFHNSFSASSFFACAPKYCCSAEKYPYQQASFQEFRAGLVIFCFQKLSNMEVMRCAASNCMC